ncbi:MAG: DUF4355 domain-containing protein [Clostridiales bacterium]|nr:DUF4355 domain-containing protein [Clostridiales bacterium]
MAENTTATNGVQNGANATDTNNGSGQNNTGTQTGGQAERTYTEAEFISEVDRRVSQAQAKWSAELDKRLDLARSEGEKLAKMNANERAKAQFETDKQNFETERARYEAERLEFEAVKQLSEGKLPISFAKMCVGKDAEETKTNIETFKTAWGEALQNAVNERMKGTTPKTGGAANPGRHTGFVDVINEMHR